MWKKTTTHSTSDLRRQSIRHQKIIWEHHIWCHVKISEVATLVSMILNFWCSVEVAAAELHLCLVIKVTCGGNALFFRWLLSLCSGLPVWLFWGQICNFWPFFQLLWLIVIFEKRSNESWRFWPIKFFMSIYQMILAGFWALADFWALAYS